MNTLLASNIKLLDLACSAEECLCWIIILLNILTIFYLVFCAYFKVTKVVRVIGYVWGSALTIGTVAVVTMHTCIFTILAAVFTALILMAVLSVVFRKEPNENRESVKEATAPQVAYPSSAESTATRTYVGANNTAVQGNVYSSFAESAATWAYAFANSAAVQGNVYPSSAESAVTWAYGNVDLQQCVNYGIYSTPDGRFMFLLFDRENRAIAYSYYSYYSQEDAQAAACGVLNAFKGS